EIGREPIAAVVADDDVADRRPKVRDVRLQRRARPGGRLVAPDTVDQGVHRDRPPSLRGEEREHRALLRAAQAHAGAVAQDFERAQDANLQVGATIRRFAGRAQGARRANLPVAHAHRTTKKAPAYWPCAPRLLPGRRTSRVVLRSLRTSRTLLANELQAPGKHGSSA